MRAQWYDGNISLPGCDKNMPGVIMAMARVNRPSIMVYGGTIKPGHLGDKKLDVVSAFEAYGQWLAKDITEEELKEVLRNACPGAGACGGMYTANTMASAIETLGMSLPYSSSYPAESREKLEECRRAGSALRYLIEHDIKPKDILTRQAFENAITVAIALGGSTNVVLHLIAMAKAADVPLTIDDFQVISDRTPLLADLKPSGKFVMEDLYDVGGVPAVQRSCCARAVARRLPDGDGLDAGGEHRRSARPKGGPEDNLPISQPLKKTGHLQILYGNLAEEGAVAKITGKEGTHFAGPAKVFDSEGGDADGHRQGEIKHGDVVVIRMRGRRAGRACVRC